MSIAQTNMIAKIAAVVAGLGLVAMTFVSAVPAKAATTDVSAQIAALQAQLAALMAQQGGSTSASVTFTRDLTLGSKGSDVTALQNWLIGKGFSIAAGATGYFGAQTKAAVAAWQASAGISPAAGYFGAKSRAAVGTTGSTGSTGGTSTGGLTGGAGKLKNLSSLGDITTDIKEGDSATKVIGFSADAQDSDMAVQRVDVSFTIASGNGSASMNKYVSQIAVYQDGKKLASMDPASGDKNGRVWTYRFSDLNGVIRKGMTGNFYVEVTPVSSIGSTEDGVSVTAKLDTDAVRAVDAEGVSETYSVPQGGTTSQSFTVSSATTGTLTINEASDNPKATTVKADINNTTEGVTLMSFNLKAKNQDVMVHDLPVILTVNGGGNISDYVQTVKLMKGSTVIKSRSATSTASSQTFLFDNIDQTISKDSSVNYTVVVDVRKIDSSGSTFTSGDTITASLNSGSAWDVEDTNGNTVTNPSTFTGNAMTFQATGITVVLVSANANKTVGTTAGSGDNTQYSISFKVTAGDDDLYIPTTVTRSTTAALTSVTWATTTSSSNGTGSASTTLGTGNLSAADTNGSDSATVFKIPAGTTRTFTLNVSMSEVAGTLFTGVRLTGFGYGTTSNTAANYLTYTSGLDTFKTQDVSMTTH